MLCHVHGRPNHPISTRLGEAWASCFGGLLDEEAFQHFWKEQLTKAVQKLGGGDFLLLSPGPK